MLNYCAWFFLSLDLGQWIITIFHNVNIITGYMWFTFTLGYGFVFCGFLGFWILRILPCYKWGALVHSPVNKEKTRKSFLAYIQKTASNSNAISLHLAFITLLFFCFCLLCFWDLSLRSWFEPYPESLSVLFIVYLLSDIFSQYSPFPLCGSWLPQLITWVVLLVVLVLVLLFLVLLLHFSLELQLPLAAVCPLCSHCCCNWFLLGCLWFWLWLRWRGVPAPSVDYAVELVCQGVLQVLVLW